MRFDESLDNWIKGEVFQGKLMIVIGLLLLAVLVVVLRGDQSFLRGLALPLLLSVAALIGYGSFQLFSRPVLQQNLVEQSRQTPQKTVQGQVDKSRKDDATYRMLLRGYAIAGIIALAAFALLQNEFYRGISLGSAALFVSLSMIDSLLRHRMLSYLERIEALLR